MNLFPKWFFPVRIFWFTLGIVFGFHIKLFKDKLVRIKWILLAVTLALIPIGMIEWEIYFRLSGLEWLDHRETILDSIYALTFIFSILAFQDALFPLSDTVNNLGVKSYGIYLTHSIFMIYASRIIFHVAPTILAYQIIFQPLIIMIGLGIPLLLMAAVNRSPLKGMYTYIFG